MINAIEAKEMDLFEADLTGMPDEEQEAGWGVVVVGAFVGWYVWQCYRSGGRPTVIQYGRLFWIECR